MYLKTPDTCLNTVSTEEGTSKEDSLLSYVCTSMEQVYTFTYIIYVYTSQILLRLVGSSWWLNQPF